ncbi:MAG: polymorphic toxin type 23 domain-containing protein, partial [Polaribacter sp.]
EHFFEVSLIHMNGRMYDAQLGRFLSPDNHIQDPYNTQSFNRYGYVWNNPLSFNDPSGEIFWAIVGVAALIGAATGAATYIVNAIITGNWSWGGFAMSVLGGAVTGALAGIVAPGAFAGLFTNATAFFWGSVATGVAASFLPAVTIPIGDFSFSISPAIAFGSGAISAGANFSMSYSDGNFNASIGFGITYATKSHGANTMGWEFRKSWAVNWDDGKTGLGICSTTFSGHNGKFDQRVGGLLVRQGDFSMRYENDGAPFNIKGSKLVSGGTDSHRSAAMKFGIGDFNIGFNIFTGERILSKNDEVEDNRGFFDKLKNIPTGSDGGFGANLPYGAVNETGIKHRMGVGFIGWKNYRIGIDSYRHLGHAIQNIGAHYLLSPQPDFTSPSNAIMPYFQYQTDNPYTLW